MTQFVSILKEMVLNIKLTVNISAKDSNTYAYTFMNHFWGLDYKNQR